MLKTIKTRQITADFYANDNGEEKLVKTTVINIDNDAVSTVFETLHEPILYAKNRVSMRKDENKLRELRYKIEDEILAELNLEKQEE